MIEKIKNLISVVLDSFGILNFLNKKLINNNSIRIINYHRTPREEINTFKKQIEFFKQNYENIDFKKFELFKKDELVLSKPGIIITFDDGLKNNYENALTILEENGFTGYFFVSVGLLNNEGYMNYDEVIDLVNRGHVVGCHTYTHHRMNKNDSLDLLQYEIVQSKEDLQKILNNKVDIFCWCGGEEETYTKQAHEIIKENYKYSFMTNNQLVYSDTDNYKIQRTNIEARWSLSLCKFQLCGIMDFLYKSKRERIDNVIN